MTSFASRATTAGVAPQPRVLVLQVGARLHYAVPRGYARANALERLYTDACASVGSLAVARRLIPSRLRSASVRRLLGRTLPPEIPPERVHVETLATLREQLQPSANARSHARLQQRILREGFAGANCLYCLDNSDLDLMKAAREAGLAVVYEQIICPSVGRILREERSRYPGIEAQDSDELVEQGIARDIEVFKLAQAVVCGSEFVREDVAAMAGPAARPALVPYGVNTEWLELPRSPVPGRILFVGAVGLRKGSHYLAEATRLLHGRGVRCEVRVVGPYDPRVVERPEFRGPEYVGQVPRELVAAEFTQADVFALPTLAEGSAMVHLEALACGLPVVTTPNCGSQVRDGEDGFLVPIRDARALADRLEQLVTDRALRAQMSTHASMRARESSWNRFGQRLMTVTRDALEAAHRHETSGPR